MTTIAILFWTGVFLVFYTYLGYGILLWMLVKIREALRPARRTAHWLNRRPARARPTPAVQCIGRRSLLSVPYPYSFIV